MNVNATEDAKQRQANLEHDEEVKKMRREFADAPRMDIEIPEIPNSKDQKIEVGINGYFTHLLRGKRINDCPLPVIMVLDEAKIRYSQLSVVKPAPEKAAPEKTSKKPGKGDSTPPAE